jgi:hypothetical protein
MLSCWWLFYYSEDPAPDRNILPAFNQPYNIEFKIIFKIQLHSCLSLSLLVSNVLWLLGLVTAYFNFRVEQRLAVIAAELFILIFRSHFQGQQRFL